MNFVLKMVDYAFKMMNVGHELILPDPPVEKTEETNRGREKVHVLHSPQGIHEM